MKKFYLLAALLCAGFGFIACDDEEDPIVPETTMTVTFEGDNFTALIDSEQYGGPLIYSGDTYSWTDPQSHLMGTINKADWSAWGMGFGWANGFAISNYIDDSETVSFDKQLSVPVALDGNFAVCYDDNSKVCFADTVARRLISLDVCPTTYTLRNMQQNAAEGYSFKAVATFTHADNTTTERDIVLADGTDVQTGWRTISMADVEPFISMTITFDGSDKDKYGLATPKYLAIDNLKIEKAERDY